MGKRVRDHLRSNVVGYVALFFAMSLGTAWAIEKNEIKSKHIGKGQVKNADLGTGAVTKDKLAANSVDGDNVVNDSLKGDDVDESSLDLPDAPAIPSSLPPSGAAGGDLAGEYPNPQVSESGLSVGGDLSGSVADAQLGPNSVGPNEANGLTGADIADLGGADDVNARLFAGNTPAANFPHRSDPSPPAGFSGVNVGFRFYQGLGFTSGASTTFNFGAIDLVANGTAGQFQVCEDGSSDVPVVMYVNGARTAVTLTGAGNPSCSAVLDPGIGGDFEISARTIRIFGTHQGSTTGSFSESYHVLGFGQDSVID